MFIGVGTLVVILLIVLIIYFVRRYTWDAPQHSGAGAVGRGLGDVYTGQFLAPLLPAS